MNQTIKAAVFDIDGTLLAQGTHEITPRNLKALEDLRNAGVTLIVATGRALVMRWENLSRITWFARQAHWCRTAQESRYMPIT